MKLADSHRDGSHWLAVVAENVRSLRFGVVQIVVHDSKVVQVERTERIRFDEARPDRTRGSGSEEGGP